MTLAPYSPLAQEEEGEEIELHAPHRKVASRPSDSHNTDLLRWTCYAVLSCTAVNIILIAWQNAGHLLNSRMSIEPAPLPRPNPYPGLETVLRGLSSPTPKPLTIWPTFLGPVNPQEPSRIYSKDPHRHFSPVGTIYPAEHHLWITREAESIVQFHARDFGMEKCNVVIYIPVDGGQSHVNNSRPGSAGGPVLIEVWRITSVSPVDGRTLSWNSRPGSGDEELLDILSLTPGASSSTPTFICPFQTLQTFRLSCRSGDCDVDGWQGKNLGSFGVTLVQSYSF